MWLFAALAVLSYSTIGVYVALNNYLINQNDANRIFAQFPLLYAKQQQVIAAQAVQSSCTQKTAIINAQLAQCRNVTFANLTYPQSVFNQWNQSYTQLLTSNTTCNADAIYLNLTIKQIRLANNVSASTIDVGVCQFASAIDSTTVTYAYRKVSISGFDLYYVVFNQTARNISIDGFDIRIQNCAPPLFNGPLVKKAYRFGLIGYPVSYFNIGQGIVQFVPEAGNVSGATMGVSGFQYLNIGEVATDMPPPTTTTVTTTTVTTPTTTTPAPTTTVATTTGPPTTAPQQSCQTIYVSINSTTYNQTINANIGDRLVFMTNSTSFLTLTSGSNCSGNAQFESILFRNDTNGYLQVTSFSGFVGGQTYGYFIANGCPIRSNGLLVISSAPPCGNTTTGVSTTTAMTTTAPIGPPCKTVQLNFPNVPPSTVMPPVNLNLGDIINFTRAVTTQQYIVYVTSDSCNSSNIFSNVLLTGGITSITTSFVTFTGFYYALTFPSFNSLCNYGLNNTFIVSNTRCS